VLTVRACSLLPLPHAQWVRSLISRVVHTAKKHAEWILVFRALEATHRTATPAEIAATDDVCVICHDDLRPGVADGQADAVVVLPACQHLFHRGCFQSFLESATEGHLELKCPICRQHLAPSFQPTPNAPNVPPAPAAPNVPPAPNAPNVPFARPAAVADPEPSGLAHADPPTSHLLTARAAAAAEARAPNAALAAQPDALAVQTNGTNSPGNGGGGGGDPASCLQNGLGGALCEAQEEPILPVGEAQAPRGARPKRQRE
jgi:hypothetical protein